MSFGDSFKKIIGMEESDDDEMITEEEVSAAKEKIARDSRTSMDLDKADRTAVISPRKSSAPSTASKPADKRFSMTSTSAFKLILIEPKSFEECPKLVDNLKNRKPVIINLEKLETDVARKIFDFMSGATYALAGNVQKVANNIFIFAPANVDIAASQESKETADYTGDSSNPWRI